VPVRHTLPTSEYFLHINPAAMTSRKATAARYMLPILGLALVGGLFVAYLWETLNRLMAGFIEPVRLLISIPVLLVFVLLLRYISRAIQRWYDQPET
jgi:hypothetical protein